MDLEGMVCKRKGSQVATGYFAQDHKDGIPLGISIIEWLHDCDPTASQEELRGLLGQMLFSGDDALKRTDALSGGEAARLIFCRLMLQKPNFLILDEPTNHLDLESINALNVALQRYPGTVLLVTHDYDVIDEVATRIWHIEKAASRISRDPMPNTFLNRKMWEPAARCWCSLPMIETRAQSSSRTGGVWLR